MCSLANVPKAHGRIAEVHEAVSRGRDALSIAPVFWKDAPAPVVSEETGAVPSEQPTEAPVEQPEPAPVRRFMCGA